AYLERMKWLITQRAGRSDEYRNFITKPHDVTTGGSEGVCVLGSFDQTGGYKMTANAVKECGNRPTTFLDHHLKLDVKRLPTGNFRNGIDLQVGLGGITPAHVLTFAKEQLALLRAGYHGSSKAYPNY